MTASPGHEIVVGVDGTPASAAALRWAVRQARSTGWALRAAIAWEVEPTLSIGWPPMPRNPEAEQLARSVLQAAVASELGDHAGLSVATSVIGGAPWDVLRALSRDAELLVVGNRGHAHAVEAVLGSVSQHCVSGAGCPVVVIRGAPGDAGIVVGVDGSAPSLAAVQWASEQAARTGTSLRLVHAVSADADGGGAAPTRRILEEAAARAATQHDTMPLVVEEREGRPAAVLEAACVGAALLVVGSRGRGAVSGGVLGSVSQHCVQHAECPVVVHRPRAVGGRHAHVA